MTFKEYKKNAMENDEAFRKEYEALAPYYALIKGMIAARIEQNLSQAELAERADTKQSNISRFESGNANPTLEFLQKLANALGKTLEIHIR